MKAKNPQPKYTSEQLEAIALKLREMPEPEKTQKEHSKQDAIKVLAKEITALQKRGYTVEQIADSLTGAGLDIATPTLRNYLTRANASKSTPRKKAAKKSEAAEASATQVTPGVSRPLDEANATFVIDPDDRV